MHGRRRDSVIPVHDSSCELVGAHDTIRVALLQEFLCDVSVSACYVVGLPSQYSTHEVSHPAKYDISLYIPMSVPDARESDIDEP